jgi:hypothetical protein
MERSRSSRRHKWYEYSLCQRSRAEILDQISTFMSAALEQALKDDFEIKRRLEDIKSIDDIEHRYFIDQQVLCYGALDQNL